jgi:hypothetical protein
VQNETVHQRQQSEAPMPRPGILGYRISEGSRQAAHFLVDLEAVEKGMMVLGYEGDALINVAEQDGRLKIVIEIGEKTSRADILQLVPKALSYRDELNTRQGELNLRQTIMERFDDLHRRGISYNALSNLVNEHLSRQLRVYVWFRNAYLHQQDVWELRDEMREIEDAEDFRRQISHWIDSVYNSNNHAVSAINVFENILRKVFSFSWGDIAVERQEGIDRIDQGEDPFVEGYPIGPDKLRETMRYWRKCQ